MKNTSGTFKKWFISLSSATNMRAFGGGDSSPLEATGVSESKTHKNMGDP